MPTKVLYISSYNYLIYEADRVTGWVTALSVGDVFKRKLTSSEQLREALLTL